MVAVKIKKPVYNSTLTGIIKNNRFASLRMEYRVGFCVLHVLLHPTDWHLTPPDKSPQGPVAAAPEQRPPS